MYCITVMQLYLFNIRIGKFIIKMSGYTYFPENLAWICVPAVR